MEGRMQPDASPDVQPGVVPRFLDGPRGVPVPCPLLPAHLGGTRPSAAAAVVTCSFFTLPSWPGSYWVSCAAARGEGGCRSTCHVVLGVGHSCLRVGAPHCAPCVWEAERACGLGWCVSVVIGIRGPCVGAETRPRIWLCCACQGPRGLGQSRQGSQRALWPPPLSSCCVQPGAWGVLWCPSPQAALHGHHPAEP